MAAVLLVCTQLESRITETQDLDKADKAIASGHSVVTTDAELIPQLANVDVIVDATGMPEIGAKVAWEAIRHKKHIVMLNVEADITIGPLLKQQADEAGIIYTGSAGDEPGAIMEHIISRRNRHPVQTDQSPYIIEHAT